MDGKGLFQDIPGMHVTGATVGRAVNYGAGNYVVTVENTKKLDYEEYLAVLEKAGFIKYVDNGETGLAEAVYSSTYTRENLVLTVTHAVKPRKTYISACLDLPLSEHLFYREEYTAGNKEGAQTRLYMRELWRFGNSFVFQLKNGHFIISDGGIESDCVYLLDFLEEIAPEGEKPVVEAWIFSHGHTDHVGVMGAFVKDRTIADRLYVEGVYFNEPNRTIMALDPGALVTSSWVNAAALFLKTTKGTHPEIYRPQTGQRYYFNDLTIDIVHAQEHLTRERYSGDFNDSSTWCMVTVEGQKCLLSGDGEKGGMETLMETYDREYLTVDILTVMHHGYNTRNDFTDYCTVKTALFSLKNVIPARRIRENGYLKACVQEWFVWGDGTRVFAFPYTVGTSKLLPPLDWKYHKGQERPEQPNLYTRPQKPEIALKDNGFAEHARVFMNHVQYKIQAVFTDQGMPVEFQVDPGLGDAGSYEITALANGWKITGSDEAGLYYGISRFLDTTRWYEDRFIPVPPKGIHHM